MFFHVIKDESPTPDLRDLIAKQHEFGGRLILYPRMWAAIVVAGVQGRIVWVPPSGNRFLAGWRQALFTVLLGSWGIMSFLAVPMILVRIFRGGVDVTELYSNSTIDPLRIALPIRGTAEKEEKQEQYAILALLLVILFLIWWFMIRPLNWP